jgi:hypothetical protein
VTKTGEPWVTVAYGTSKTGRACRRGLLIINLADMYEIGLPQATLFDLDRQMDLPWAADWFGSLNENELVVGSLNARVREYLNLIIRTR